MSLIKDNMFLTNVSEHERILLMKSNAFRPALAIASNGTLFVSHVEYLPQNQYIQVRFTTSEGVPIGRLTVSVNDYTTFVTYDRPTCVMGTSMAAESARPMYVAKALFKYKKDGSKSSARGSLEMAQTRARLWHHETVRTLVRNAHHKLMAGRRTNVAYRDFFNHSQVGVLLAAFFGEMTSLQVNPIDMAKFEEIRALRDQRRAFRGQLSEAMKTVFGKPKLLVTYIKNHGYMISEFDVAHSFDQILDGVGAGEQGVVVRRAPEFYRSLEHIPLDKGRDEICGKLAYLKMNLSKEAGMTWGDDDYALVPTSMGSQVDVIVNEDIFGSVMIGTVGTTFVVVDA